MCMLWCVLSLAVGAAAMYAAIKNGYVDPYGD